MLFPPLSLVVILFPVIAIFASECFPISTPLDLNTIMYLFVPYPLEFCNARRPYCMWNSFSSVPVLQKVNLLVNLTHVMTPYLSKFVI